MNTIAFYLGAVALSILGLLCLRHTSPYTRAGGDKFEKRGKRRLIGYLLFVVAGLSLIMALIAQISNAP